MTYQSRTQTVTNVILFFLAFVESGAHVSILSSPLLRPCFLPNLLRRRNTDRLTAFFFWLTFKPAAIRTAIRWMQSGYEHEQEPS